MKNVFAIAIICLVSGCAHKAPQSDARLNDPPADGEAAVAMPEGPPVVRQTDAAAPAPTPDEPGDADGQVFVTRADLDGFLDRGPSYVLTVVTVEPMHAAEGFAGYQITEVTSGARAFMTPQLRVGDVVTHVNGVRLMRPEDYMQAWRSLDKVTAIRVDFLRKSQPMHAVWVVK